MTRIRSLFQWLFLLSAVAIAVLLAAPAWAAYVIYVQGTNNFTPGTPNVPVSTIFNGSFSDQANFADPLTVQNLSYPATFGLLNVLTYHGPGLPPTLNKSVAIGVAALDAQIKADQAADPAAQIYVIGYSEGAIVGTQEALALQGQDPATAVPACADQLPLQRGPATAHPQQCQRPAELVGAVEQVEGLIGLTRHASLLLSAA